MFSRFAVVVLILSIVGISLASCGSGADPNAPPTISYGKDVCARCGMIISEEKFASGLVAKDGKSRVFDDPGEMIATVQEEGLGTSRAWVHDYNSMEWIDATEASYVMAESVITPMGTGVVAFVTPSAASDFAGAHAGMVMSWEDMLTKWDMKGGMH